LGFKNFSQCYTAIFFVCQVCLLTLTLLLLCLTTYLKNVKKAFCPPSIYSFESFVKFLFDNYANIFWFFKFLLFCVKESCYS